MFHLHSSFMVNVTWSRAGISSFHNLLNKCEILKLQNCQHRFFGTLVVLESQNGQILPAALSAVSAAKLLKNPITVLLPNNFNETSSIEINNMTNIEKIIMSHTGATSPEIVAETIHRITSEKEFSNIIASQTSYLSSIIPRLAAKLNVMPISNVVSVLSENTFLRPIFAGNAFGLVKSQQEPNIITVLPTAFTIAVHKKFKDTAKSHFEKLELTCDVPHCRLIAEPTINAKGPSLTSAKIVVAGGRGFKDKKMFEEQLLPLTKILNAAVGASRAAVDSGFVENAAQIGQTGKIIAPDLYIAVGISGAIQHIAGIKESKLIVAVNKDPEAPIFQNANLGLVGNIEDVLPQFVKKIKYLLGHSN